MSVAAPVPDHMVSYTDIGGARCVFFQAPSSADYTFGGQSNALTLWRSNGERTPYITEDGLTYPVQEATLTEVW